MKNRNQLFVLLAVAAWVSFFTYRYSTQYSGVNLEVFTAYILAHSLPALVFGAVLFWWFGKSKGG
jgi:hypothetical protein